MQPAIRERAGLLFSALSNPTRLRIVELLCAEEKTVNEVAAELRLSQSGTSQHLANLTRAGVLSMEARGTSHLYKVRGPRIPRILELIEQFCEIHALYGAPEEPTEQE
ncbi:MAG: transcriptional regulator, ArsR family [Chthonomonadaceae bacterium]|nr:transcriptional regulator, ArsR family [Chthonomonadaceae bacterium]